MDYKSGQLLGITNRGRFRDYKMREKDYKSGQGLQKRAKRLQIGADITNQSRTAHAINSQNGLS